MTDERQIFAELKPLLAEVLGIDPERVRPESLLVRDLGAESIDLLDLSFRVEERFQIAIHADEIERDVRQHLGAAPFEVNGRLTVEAIEEIRRSLPELDAARLVPGLRKADLPAMLTVAFFVRLIARKQAAAAERTRDA